MQTLKLNPWPFNDGVRARLHWLCTPYRDFSQRWFLKAVFIQELEFEPVIVEYPWGILPILRLGHCYINGYLTQEGSSEKKFELSIPNLSNGALCDGLELPIGLYNLFQNSEMENQRLWKFTIEDAVYYLPCIELLRSFLTPSRILANYILKPNSIDVLISETKRDGDILEVDLNSEIPATLVNQHTVAHLVWLKYDQYARSAWESVYRNIFARAIESSPFTLTNELYKGVPVALKPPITGQCLLTFNARVQEQEALILEVVSIKGLRYPEFTQINYSHSSLKKSQSHASNQNKKRNFLKNRPDNCVLDSSKDAAKIRSVKALVKVPSTSFGFKTTSKFSKLRLTDKLVVIDSSNATSESYKLLSLTKQDDLDRDATSIYSSNTVSGHDSVFGGKLEPVEFAGLEIIQESNEEGLTNFLAALQIVSQRRSNLSFNLKVVVIPDNCPLSLLPDHSRRTCAIVEVISMGKIVCYILEVSRPDNCWVPTLFMKPLINRSNNYLISHILGNIIKKMAKQNGDWDIISLKRNSSLIIASLKHELGHNPLPWAKRIIRKLNIFG